MNADGNPETKNREKLLGMKSLPIPSRDEDFAADPAELIFDLTFVFAFSRLVYLLVHHPTWTGVGEFVLLFAMIWMPWTQFTWSANAVAGNRRPVRLLFMIATVASIPMAASVTSAFDDGGPVFAFMLSAIMVIAMFTMVAGLPADSPVRKNAIRYFATHWIMIALMIGGAFFDRETRIWMWIGAVAVAIIGTIRTKSSEWLVRPGHFAERHGLLIIVALGEVIVAIGLPVVGELDEGAGLSRDTVISLVSAGALAGLLWWGYFDRINPAFEHRHSELTNGTDSGNFARHVYTYVHFPLIGGLMLTAAALEEITLHPTEPLAAPFRWMFLVGLACYLLSIAAGIARAFSAGAWERLAAATLLGVFIAAAGDLDGYILLIVVDVALLITLSAEHHRVEVKHRVPTDW